MSENGAETDPVSEGSETDMKDPENYGSLTIEDPDGDDEVASSSTEPSGDDG